MTRRARLAVALLLAAGVAVALYLSLGPRRAVWVPRAAVRAPDWNGDPTTGSDFNGTRAFEDLVRLVRLGPRVSGSDGARRAASLIQESLRQAGWSRWPAEAWVATASGAQNVIALRPGARGDNILLVTHYDSLALPDGANTGANESASGVAVLLEIARAFGTQSAGSNIWLVFCDAHEANSSTPLSDPSLRGASEAARALARADVLRSVRALLLVDLVADADLVLTPGGFRDARLLAILEEEARHSHVRVNPKPLYRFRSDHEPFVERGVRNVLPIVDLEYGGDPAPGPHFHTSFDRIDKLSANNLARVGDLVVRVVRRVDADVSLDGSR